MSPTDRDAAWDRVPCGLLTLAGDGMVLDVNQTFTDWVGLDREELVGRRRLSDLLSVGGRIYWETHLSPILVVEGRIDEVAVELKAPDGRLPVLMTAVVQRHDERPGGGDGGKDDGGPTLHVSLSSARERSRFERELVAARRSAEASATQTRILQEVTASLSGAAGVDGVVESLMTAATDRLGASAATFWTFDPSTGLTGRTARGEAVAASLRPSARAARRRLGSAVEAGRVVVPLRGMSSLHGVLSLLPRTDAGTDPLPLELLTAVGQHAGLALDRANLYEKSAKVAHELQQSLLSAPTPQDDRFVVTTVYRPGVVGLQVGGDWYDAFMLDTEVLAVVVGDVVGKGLNAASAMGQLRSAVRAIAGSDCGPAVLVTRLDRFVQQVEAAATATLAYAEIDLTSGQARFICAGHMPPVLLPADGPPVLVWEGRSTPLGVVQDGVPRHEGQLQLQPGDQLLLFTDGLVERRQRLLSDGLAALMATVRDLSGAPPADLVHDLTARLLADEQTGDDVCVLLLSWNG